MAQLASAPVEALSVPAAAKAAGVSIRTVYHYFPNRDAQVAAVAAWLEAQIVGDGALPRNADDLPALARRLYAAFGRNELLVRAQAQKGIARLIRRRRRMERLAAIDAAIAALGADQRLTLWAATLVKHLAGADAGLAFRDEFGLSPEESGELVAWVTELVVQALRSSAQDEAQT